MQGPELPIPKKNRSDDKLVKFLQIWVFPNQRDVLPRYDQKSFNETQKHNKLLTIVSPMGEPYGVNIYQDAWFSLGRFDRNITLTYNLKKEMNGVYAFLLEGDVTINDIVMNRRDGLGISDEKSLTITANSDAEILLMEVPMI